MNWLVMLTTCSALLFPQGGSPQKWTGCETAQERAFATQNECADYVAATFNHWNEKRECQNLGDGHSPH